MGSVESLPSCAECSAITELPGREVVFIAAPGAWQSAFLQSGLPALVENLDRRFPNWGICGNSGLLPDGRTSIRAFRDARKLGLHRSGGARPVLALGDTAALLNVSALRSRSIDWPSGLTANWGTRLSCACLHAGLLPLFDDRMFTLHPAAEVPDPAVENREELLAHFDRALLAGRQKPSLAIVCRTQLDRPAMLARAIGSMAREIEDAGASIDASIRIVTDVEGPGLQSECDRLRRMFPGVDLRAAALQVREKRVSRIDLLLRSLEGEAADFVWYVDDDDSLQPGALASVARMLRTGEPQIVVGHARIFNETWPEETAATGPSASERGPLYPADRVLWALGGQNHTPICSMVLSVAALRARTRNVAAVGEYMEDYFLLLQVLTRGETILETLDVELAGVSLRERGNTVTQTDHTIWHQSHAEFLGEALARATDNNPLLWRLSEELLRVQAAATQLQAAATQLQDERQRMLRSRSWRWSRPIRMAGALIRRIKGR